MKRVRKCETCAWGKLNVKHDGKTPWLIEGKEYWYCTYKPITGHDFQAIDATNCHSSWCRKHNYSEWAE